MSLKTSFTIFNQYTLDIFENVQKKKKNVIKMIILYYTQLYTVYNMGNGYYISAKVEKAEF